MLRRRRTTRSKGPQVGLWVLTVILVAFPATHVPTAHPFTGSVGARSTQERQGYRPEQIRAAYSLDRIQATGRNQTVAVVVAYGNPSLVSDLAVFSKQFGLPDAHLEITYATGQPPVVDRAWALETSLDVEWVHALAPDATMLLSIARTDRVPDLLAAVDVAVMHHAQIVSMSWGIPEFPAVNEYERSFQRRGTVFVAGSGDRGAAVNWPAVSPSVLAVGGTRLILDEAGNRVGDETAWSGSGGGVSSYFEKPWYQVTSTSAMQHGRTVPDVALVADTSPGVAVYCSTPVPAWYAMGQTSFAAPAWSAILALANETRGVPLASVHGALYQLSEATTYDRYFYDILEGTNGNCGTLCTAVPGYDTVTGLGTPHADRIVSYLAGYGNASLLARIGP